MKKFNLKEYLKNPTKEVITERGNKIRIICTNAKLKDFPIVALETLPDGTEILCSYSAVGIPKTFDISSRLIFASTNKTNEKKKKKRWINLYNNIGFLTPGTGVYSSKELAFNNRIKDSTFYKTAKIEWEED